MKLKEVATLLSAFIILLLIFCNVCFAAKMNDLSSKDDLIIKKFEVAGIKFNMKTEQAIQKLRIIAAKYKGIVLDKSVMSGQGLLVISIEDTEGKITGVSFHAHLVGIRHNEYGMDINDAKKYISKKFNLEFDDDEYVGEKVVIKLDRQYLFFNIKQNEKEAGQNAHETTREEKKEILPK